MTTTTRKPRKLTWTRASSTQWYTEEQVDGTPDFMIFKDSGDSHKYGRGYRLWHRTSSQTTAHESLKAAKDHAGSI